MSINFSKMIGFALCLVFIVSAGGAPQATMLNSRLIGGENAVISMYPYQVSLERLGRYICGGAMISERYIATTASCAQAPSAELDVRAGSSLRGEGGSVHQVDKVVVHEKYDNSSQPAAGYDLAVLRVREPFQLDDTRRPAELFQLAEALEPGTRAELTGWGDLGTGELALQMQLVRLAVLERGLCAGPGQICAAETGKRACYGDAGSPLAVGARLAGIASWGFDCDPAAGSPEVFTEIAHFRDWIDEHAAY